MEQETLNKQDTIKLFEQLLDLFTHEGWKEFIRDVDGKFIVAKESSFTECVDNNDWQERKGVVKTLAFVLSYEQQIRDAYDRLIEEEIS